MSLRDKSGRAVRKLGKVVHLSSVQVEQDQFPKDPRAFLEARWLDGWMVSPRVAMLELE